MQSGSEKQTNNILQALRQDPERILFIVFLACMTVYYGYRMFTVAPWYDELYTYNFFISRGPVYAGIHWPVPNNHLGYSALSGFFYVLTHDPYISLRGIAFLSSVGNLVMLYMTGRYLMKPGMRLLLPAVYAGTWQVNNITVQGRGYSLSVNMMLIAVVCLLHLCFDDCDGTEGAQDHKKLRKYYILWAFSLILGFYTVMTTLYWVVTLCLCALCCLLSVKRVDRLIRLIISSVCGAVGTLVVYSAVWLAIGSNLLIRDESGIYSQLSHFTLIRSHPVLSLKTGAEYMLATPYIQSVDKNGYLKAFCDHWIDMLNHMYSFGVIILVIMLIGIVLAGAALIARHKYLSGGIESENGDKQMNDGLCVFSWLVICFALATPITVFVQIKLPYIRVFTFYAVAVSLGVTYVIYVLFGALKDYFTYGIGVIVTLLVIAQILSSDYNIPYGEKEEAVSDLMKQVDLRGLAEAGAHICLTDVDQEYMYRFLYDEYPEMADMSDADVIVLDKDMLDPEAEFHWEFYYDHNSVDMDRIGSMKQLLRNTYYEVYITDEISDKISVVR